MRFGVLGPLTVWAADGRPVPVPEPKTRALLADLLVHEGHPVSTGRLAADLWGADPPGNPTNTLQTKISQLRRALGDPDRIVRQSAGYTLRLAPGELDAAGFAERAGRARAAGEPRERADLLGDALALWRGPAYADLRDWSFTRGAAARLDEQRLTALEDLAEARLALGEHSVLADELGELVAAHPLRERLRAAHLRALYRGGRAAEALAGYEELRRRLADELGTDPGPELAALHRAILRQDPALASAPAPTTSAARPRGNLPAPLTDLVGRASAVAEVGTLLDTARLLTLTGPGGVGKTRLALAVAAGRAARFPDGAWLVELAAVRTPDSVVDVVAAALGVRDETEAGTRPTRLADRLAGALRGQSALLVLDNCEHLVEPVAALAAHLLAAAPGLRVLATSRESLAVPGETLFRVAPLDPPAAADLFAARAVAAGVRIAPEDAAVAAICARLDGLPLALELAATQVPALGLRGLAEGLDDRFRLLTAAGRGVPARQRTLRAMIDWSWELLDEPQRAALLGLVVQPGGATLEAAEAVCPGSATALAQLVHRSMVIAEPDRAGDVRYRLLETVAAYGLERLAGDQAPLVRRDAYYATLAERAEPHLYGREQRAWLERLDLETPNLGAALDGAVERGDRPLALRLVNALAWYWYLRGRHREGRRSIARALAVPGPGGDAARAATWETGFAIVAGEGGLDRALPKGGDARARWWLAHTHLHFGDVPVAEELTERALAAFRANGDAWGEAAALASRAKRATFRGDIAGGTPDGERSLALFTELGDRWGRRYAGDQLAYLAEIAGDYATAGRLHREGLRAAEDLGLWTEVSYALASLGRIALLTGDHARAKEFHERAMRLAAEQSNRFAEEFARVGLAQLARRTGDFDGAEAHLRTILAWHERLAADHGRPFYGVTLVLAELGFVAEERGDAVLARSLHERGLAAAREIGDPRAEALAHEGLAGVAALDGDRPKAWSHLTQAIRLRASAGAPLPRAERRDVERIVTALTRRPAGPPVS
jgi:predicted ATPase/DNA-binding SARP family transcriptional activator